MNKLLSAGFARVRKDNWFWLLIPTIFIISLINILSAARSFTAMTANGFVVTLEDYYFTLAPMMGLFFLTFISLFLGTEYSDGAIRNKLVVGHTRLHIYLTNFIICFSTCLIFLALWLTGGIPGFFLIGPMEMGIGGLLTYCVIGIGFSASLASLFTVIGTLSGNKALTVVFSLIIWLVMLFISSALYDRLSIPEMQEGMFYIDGEFVMLDPTPHPLYLSGTVRTVCECLLDFLPTGQCHLMADAAIEHPVRQFIFAVIFTIVTLSVGYAAFLRKDIK